jgi:hypothetical protein
MDEERTLQLTEALARHSLIFLDATADGPARGCSRPFASSSPSDWRRGPTRTRSGAATPTTTGRSSSRPTCTCAAPTTTSGWHVWRRRPGTWPPPCAGTSRTTPHRCRTCSESCGCSGSSTIAWARRGPGVEQLLPTADSLEPQARAELLWTATATAEEVGDDAAALEAIRRLAPLLDRIGDPYLHAVSQLSIAWALPIAGDFEGALQKALDSVEHLRSQDEPYWTAVALLSAGYLETTLGRQDDGLRRMQEARDMAQRFGLAWLDAWSRVQLGRLAVKQGRLEEGQALLAEALELSLRSQNTRNVALCLAGFAELALAQGDLEPSALMAGAAQGLLERAGLRAWPMLRRGEAELVARVRDALGEDRFDQLFATGSQLKQQEAVAAVRNRSDAGTHGS